jgi:dipeptidyl aminopeptidase/acylaminoacyl peptidase
MANLTLAAGLLIGVAAPALCAEPAPMPLEKAAKMFGARPAVAQMSLSPDGKKIAYVGAAQGQASVLFVGDLATGDIKPITYSDNKPLDLRACWWSAEDRLVCWYYGVDMVYAVRVSYTRIVALDADGKNMKALAAPVPSDATRPSQYDGTVIDWLDHKGQVLMARDHVSGQTTGTLISNNSQGGIGVDLVDTRTNKARPVEHPLPTGDDFITDGKGHVRIRGLDRLDSNEEQYVGFEDFQYRSRDEGPWQAFAAYDTVGNKGLHPIAVDPVLNAAYAFKDKDGRRALYRVSLDGSMKEELVLDNPRVDIDDVLKVHERVVGAYYTAEREVDVYFDPEYKALVTQLARVLPKTPLIDIVDSTPDENVLVIRASSDTDEGRFYIYQKSTHALQQLMPVQPQAEGQTLATVQPITYKSFDGTEVPAYLTLPPGSSGKHVPAIVMPHGGPGSRDVWGFDWLAQFFAARGYAVIQPEFRGSTGFGESWFLKNGFQSWKTSVGDVNAAGRWLIAQGIADPAKLGIFGWSYGGYAALQSNVLDPDLFKAVVAVAPVTDLTMLRNESGALRNNALEKQFIGAGPLLEEASPDRHAAAFKAPVLMFHGMHDINVGFAESVAMNDALHHAGKQSDLIRYPELDHQLGDSQVRADMLSKADQFLRKAMGMPAD